jgi:hypothetical protein
VPGAKRGLEARLGTPEHASASGRGLKVHHRIVDLIKRRADDVWRARYRDAGGREHARHFDRRVDAQRWLDEATSAVVTGAYTDPALARVTVGEWGRRWLDGHAALKPSTRGRYESLSRIPDPAGKLADLDRDITADEQGVAAARARIAQLEAEPTLVGQSADRLAAERDAWRAARDADGHRRTSLPPRPTAQTSGVPRPQPERLGLSVDRWGTAPGLGR